MFKIKVLFVCLGNICRSPLAEGVFRKRVVDKELDEQFLIDSCGTSQYHIGESPDPRTIANAQENGVLLTSRARQFKKKDFREFDYIVVMDQSNEGNVKRLDQARTFYDKVYMLRDWDDEDRGGNVPDPYFMGSDGFQLVFDIVDRSVDHLLVDLIERHELG